MARHRRVECAAGCALAMTVCLAGCRARCEPSCLPYYEHSVQAPLDVRGAFDGAAALSRPGETLPPALDPAADPAPLPSPSESTLAARPDLPSLQAPPDLPGADAPPLRLPPGVADMNPADRRAAIAGLYPPLPEVDAPVAFPAAGGPLDLAALQELALANSPALRAAAAAVERHRGLAIQAGAPPNPHIGYQSDTVNTARSAGYQGAYVQQTYITGGKLQLAEAAAQRELASAQLALRRTRVEVATAVRTAYFAALVAREKLRIHATLAAFTEDIYEAQIRLVEAGESAAYEPLQLRVFVLQSRAIVVQAEQEYASARRQLAAALGLPLAPLGEPAGRIDMPVPALDFDSAQALMLAVHTDLAIAGNAVAQSQVLLRLAQVTPRPDVDTTVVVQYDDTTPGGATTVNLQVGGAAPLWNRNRGNIIAAQAAVREQQQQAAVTQNQLIARLADAYARYESYRRLVEKFQTEALRDQVQAYRGVYERYRTDAQGLQFTDVAVAQQTLSTLLTQYVTLLGEQWRAVVDVAELLQADDLYALGELCPVPPLPELPEPPTADDGDAPNAPTAAP